MEGEREIEFAKVMKQEEWYIRKSTGLEPAPPHIIA